MAMSSGKNCCECLDNSLQVAADFWCNNCQEGLCKECLDIHKKVKITKDHQTIDIEIFNELPPKIQNCDHKCQKHGLFLDLYCPNHSAACCDVCVKNDHSGCTEISSLSNFVKNIKTSNAATELNKNLSDILNDILTMETNRIETEDKTAVEKVERKQAVIAFKETIIKTVDALCNDTDLEIDAIVSTESEQNKIVLSKIQTTKAQIQEAQSEYNMIKKHASEIQCFIAMQQLEKQLDTHRKTLQKILNDKSMKEKLLNVEFNQEIKQHVNSWNRLASVAVRHSRCGVDLVSDLSKHAQSMEVQENKRNVKTTFKREIAINTSKNPRLISNIKLLSNGLLVICDFNNRPFLVNDQGKVIREISSTGVGPWDVAEISEKALAFTMPRKNYFCLINIENARDILVRTVNTEEQCFGIYHQLDKLIVQIHCKGIGLYNLNGKKLGIMPVGSSDTKYIAVIDTCILYPDYKTQQVMCFDVNGERLWCCKSDLLREPRGLCVDKNENIFVVGRESNNIVAIFEKGKHMTDIPIAKHGLQNPRCVCFDEKTSSLYVGCENANKISVFTVSYY